MLKYLKLHRVGPATEMELELGSRLNLLTGDNGLGKSFLLDIAWWALTRRWPRELNSELTSGYLARPARADLDEASITFELGDGAERYESKFRKREQSWGGPSGRPANRGLILYLRVDGGFAVWDPARNYWSHNGDSDLQERPPAYVFASRNVWDGLPNPEGGSLCNGLIADWAIWQKENGAPFRRLKAALKALSIGLESPLEPGELTRIDLDDVRDMPTLRSAYGPDIPVAHASSGIRRILALAYLLVWSRQEHERAADLLGEEPSDEVVFLVDEIEAHLHPRWQRSILGSLLSVVDALAGDAVRTQLLVITHSPLVLASAEACFDDESDAWFDLDLEVSAGRQVVALRRRAWQRRGDVGSWLTSDAFDLSSSRSLEAEEVLEQAAQALSRPEPSKDEVMRLDGELRRILSDVDPFWIRWRYVGEKQGWLR